MYLKIIKGFFLGKSREGGKVLVGGIDEAGRGPVVGPMVIVGVEVYEENMERIEVRDSKKYDKRGRRRKFFEIVPGLERVHVRVISPWEIDEYVERGELNKLEARYFSSIIFEMKARKIYVDAFSNPAELALRELEVPEGKEIICEHKADEKYKVVSAASIIAKVIRDASVRGIEEELGRRVGSGYPSDEKTMEFLRSWVEEKGKLPPWVRKSWKTCKRVGKGDHKIL